MFAKIPTMPLKQGPRKTKVELEDIELVLFDVDNTLVGNESPDMPTERFKSAAVQTKKYVKIGLASARGLPKLEPIMSYLDINGPSIMLNGSQVYDFQQKKYLANWDISPLTAKEVLSKLDKIGITHWINDSGTDYFPEKSGAHTIYREQIDEWDRKSSLDPDTEYDFKNPILIVAAGITEEQVKQVRQYLKDTGDQAVASYVVHESKAENGDFQYDLLILNKDANKRHAFHELLKRQGMTSDVAMVVGDGRNDEVIVASAGIGVAMSNAAEQTISAATHIAPNQWEDGAALVLEELIRAKQSAQS